MRDDHRYAIGTLALFIAAIVGGGIGILCVIVYLSPWVLLVVGGALICLFIYMSALADYRDRE